MKETIVLVVMVFLATASSAETIKLRSGKVVEG